MSLKNLFKSKEESISVSKTSISSSISSGIESEDFFVAKTLEKERFTPSVDFSNLSSYVRYGSAEKYFEDSINRILSSYPYDGSLKEKSEWHNSSSLFDLYVFGNLYPRTSGYISLGSSGLGTPTGTASFGSTFLRIYSSDEYIDFKGGPHSGTFYNEEKGRVSNLSLNFNSGNTIEFWFKQNNYENSGSDVIFSAANSSSVGDDDFGYCAVLFDHTSSHIPAFTLSCGSGSAFADHNFVSSLDADDSTWHHYAFEIKNSGSNTISNFYIDGNFVTESIKAGSMNAVTGAMLGRIGACVPMSTSSLYSGYGRVSSSIDEFRFWKEERGAKNIGRFWNTNIGAGTDTDDANTELGIYFKFNEGITNNASYDALVLDYSGRLSNGTWTGYVSGARSTSSAINEYDDIYEEFLDPIIYSFHEDVVSLLQEKKEEGRSYDMQNGVSLLHSLPSYIIEEDEDKEQILQKIIQIIASYLDILHLEIEHLPKIQFADYASGSQVPHKFYKNLLRSDGFVIDDILNNSSIFESLYSRDENKNFKEKIEIIKDYIYSNIYNNLSYIYKSKGTNNSLRNLLRCFGVDNELIRINHYAHNAQYTFEDNYEESSKKKKSINFSDPDNNFASIVSYPISGNLDTTGSFESVFGEGHSYSIEAEAIFPKQYALEDGEFFREPSFVTSSIFGLRNADSDTDLTVSSDKWDLSIYTVRQDNLSKNAQFVVSSSVFGSILTSSLIEDVYDGRRWNVRFSLYPEKYPLSSFVTGTKDNYIMELYGVSSDSGEVTTKFICSSSIATSVVSGAFLSDCTKLYAGAKCQNLTGSSIIGSDIKLLSIKAWADYVSTSSIDEHSKDANNFGVSFPYKNTFLFQEAPSNFISKADSLIVHWEFNNISETDNNGSISIINDITSGSYLNKINNFRIQHTAKGFNFAENEDVTSNEIIGYGRKTLPEIIRSEDMITIVSEEEKLENFKRDYRPNSFYTTFEKSMYAIISQEILNFFSSVKDFNNIIGEPVQKYRANYNGLRILRQIFFNRISNTPDFHKFLDFYKWLDSSMSNSLMQLVPASANTSNGILNVVESHILERPKYKFPYEQLIFISPEPNGNIFGINQLKHDWKHGHAPENLSQSDNCLWWTQKAEREQYPLSSSDANLNNSRKNIFDSLKTSYENERKASRKISGDVFVNRKKYVSPLMETINISTASNEKICNDYEDLLNKKYKNIGNTSPYNAFEQNGEINLTSHHFDGYSNSERPLQSTFGEENIGGLTYRHTDDRYEAWTLDETNNQIIPNKNRFIGYRDNPIKSTKNIKNIANKNYKSKREVIQAPGRSNHNLEFQDGTITASAPQTIFNLMTSSFTLPTRDKISSVFVERFSSPGSKETMSRGYLDCAAEEKSVYNAQPFRNMTVVKELNSLETRHSLAGGYDSLLGSPSASYNKVNRNTKSRMELSGSSSDVYVSSSFYNNKNFISAIPAEEMVYDTSLRFDVTSSAEYRKNKENNIFVITKKPYKNETFVEKTTSFKEPMVTSKFKPILYTLMYAKDKDINFNIFSSYGNNIFKFANKAINSMVYNSKTKNKIIEQIEKFYNSQNKFLFNGIQYSETIYPKVNLAYLSSSRQRLFYEENDDSSTNGKYRINRRSYWRDLQSNRGLGQSTNSQGFELTEMFLPDNKNIFFTVPATQSMWPIDMDENPNDMSDPLYIGELNYSTMYTCFTGSYTSTASINMNFIESSAAGESIAYNTIILTSSNNPFYDSYMKYCDDIRNNRKEYAIIPEFRVSDFMSYYGTNPFKKNSAYLKLDGAHYSSSAENESSAIDSNFMDNFVVSDQSEYLKDIIDKNKNIAQIKKISLSCKGIKKLLPYNGFYPSTRVTQIASILSSSMSQYVEGEKSGSKDNVAAWQAILQPIMSPGILFNSIKSGIAVDYPIYKEEIVAAFSGTLQAAPNYRLPFETIINLGKIPKFSPIYLINPQYGISKTFGLWSGKKSNQYEMAMHNFVAETSKFFLQNERMSAIISKPESEFGSLKSGSTYYMDVELYKTEDLVICSSSSDASGRFFGPPVQYTASIGNPNVDGTDPAYAPFTPPYYYGTSSVRISFTPDENRKYSISEIFANVSTVFSSSYNFVYAAGDTSVPYPAEEAIMNITASINILGKTRLNAATWSAISGKALSVRQEPSSDFDTWTISPKFECPVLNLSSSNATSKCIWFDRGIIPEESSGIFYRIKDSFEPSSYNDLTGSLIQICGFAEGTEVQKVGKIADSKEISEAIVAIPYLDDGSGKRFIKINKASFENQKQIYDRGGVETGTIFNMIEKMNKYVIPPQYNFLDNKTVEPFAMYIFEFKTNLDNEDLANIWQGIKPRISDVAEEDEIIISHEVGDSKNFFEEGIISDAIKFMFFKVKRKATWDYYKTTLDSKDDGKYRIQFNIGNQNNLYYSYNWPYDHFSLVEKAKVDITYDFVRKEQKETDKNPLNLSDSSLFNTEEVSGPLVESKRKI